MRKSSHLSGSASGPSTGLQAALLSSILFGVAACNTSSGQTAPSASAATTPAPAVDPNARVIAIEATDKGFVPSTIKAKAGESLTLRFTRTTESECLKAIDIPSLGIKRDLPVKVAVDVPVKADKAGEIKFQCWMAMMLGKIVVE